MIEYIEGDIFESPAQVIVNTVNTVGVMGKGLALSFKRRYPEMFEKYRKACEKKQLTIGKLMLFYEADHWVLLFPTKENWRNPSKLEYIEQGLEKFCRTYDEKHITSIAFPRLGCGNGALDWKEVRPMMEHYLAKLPINVYIYLGANPDLPPEHTEQRKTLEWLRQHAKDMSFIGLKDDLQSMGGMVPYTYTSDGYVCEMLFRNQELHLCIDGKSFSVPEDNLYEIWDNLRVKMLVDLTESSPEETAVYGLLQEAGYLSKIRIFNSALNKMVAGYQLNQGLKRMRDFL